MIQVRSRVRVLRGVVACVAVCCLFGVPLAGCGGGGGGTSPGTVSAPTITAQPASQTVKAGTQISFSVAATGDGLLSYQWQRNGTDVPGGSAAQYSIVAQEADLGTAWTVRVRDAAGRTTQSQTATLTVTAAGPGISLLAGDVSAASLPTRAFADGTGSAARFDSPKAIAVDKTGNVYVTDTDVVRKISPNGEATTFAGVRGQAGLVDGVGTQARFSSLRGLTVDSAGNLYVSDASTVRKISTSASVSTLAGTAQAGGSVDGTGSAARFARVESVAVDSRGNLFVHDASVANINISNALVRKITPSGVVSRVYPGYSSVGYFDAVAGIATDSRDHVYSASCGGSAPFLSVTRFDALGESQGSWAAADCWNAMVFGKNDELFAASANQIVKRSPDGTIGVVAGLRGATDIVLGALPGRLGNVTGVAVGPDGSLFVLANAAVLQVRLR